ncbi:MAG: hypothetical protein U0840_24935, partial [Gemmataceae bacterium]
MLTLLVIIVVARPLVGGEFPGQMADLADPGSMALTFLTLLALAGWAGWRVLRREPAIYLGWADLAVLGVAGLGFFGATWAGYARPAWLAGWDWLSLGAGFFLVRQLAVHAEEKHGLMAVLLAVAVALSAEGVYQAVRVLPAEARAEEKYREDKLDDDPYGYHRTEFMVRGLTPSPLELFELRDRLERSRVHGPYFRADSLAAVLALTFPLAAGVVLASLRGRAALWQILLAGVCLVGVGAVLVLSRSWPAVLAAGAGGLAGLGFLVLPRRGALGLTVLLLVAWAGLVWQLGLAARAVEVGPGAMQV